MKALVLALVVLLAPAPAIAGDEQAPTPPPVVPRAGWTPPAAPPVAVDPDQLAALVDRAVDRALERRLGSSVFGDSVFGHAPASPAENREPKTENPGPAAASPQGVLASPQRAAPRFVRVRVEVPASPCRRAIAAVGERMVRCGEPRVRMVRVAACPEPALPSPQR